MSGGDHVAAFTIKRLGSRWYCELRVDGAVLLTSPPTRDRRQAIKDRDTFQAQMRAELGATRKAES